MRAFTDYPIIELGDSEHRIAPIRECEVVSYDGDKYCKVIVNGVIKEIKKGYLYENYGRVDYANKINVESLK